MLTGEFRPTLDQKNRIFVPSKLREELGETFMIARDVREKCLKMYSLEGWAEYIAPIKAQPRAVAEKAMRVLHSSAAQVTPDSQGRVLIPAKLVEFAEIEKNIVVIGCYDYAEIWAEEAYSRLKENEDVEEMIRELESFGL